MSQEWTSRQAYVERVLELYRKAPETPARSSRLDRHLAEEFYERQVKIEEVEAATPLATAPNFESSFRCAPPVQYLVWPRDWLDVIGMVFASGLSS